MVTNYPRRIATRDVLRTTTEAAHSEEGFVGRAWRWLRQAFCGLKGHDTLLHFEQERISLRCVSCGHETPGWQLDKLPPTVTVRADTRRHALAHPQLIGARRIA